MKYVDLRNKQAIAEDGPCMSQAAHGHVNFFYVAVGDGWVKITTKGENCNGQATLVFIDNPDIPGTADVQAQADAIAAAQASLDSNKQMFSGAVVDAPDPTWS